MKHSDLKVGMKVKRVANFSNSYHTASEGSISTVQNIYSDCFNTVKEKNESLCWEAEYFEPVEETKEEVQMQKIDINKKYRTRCGYPVRVLCVDRNDPEFPVVVIIEYARGDSVNCYPASGLYESSVKHDLDLIEVSPYEDFKKDDKIMVRDFEGEEWQPRYFAGVYNGKPYVYYDGGNSWTKADNEVFSVTYCRKPTEQELAG